MNFEASIIYRVEHKTRELPEFSSGHGKMKVGMYSFAWPNGRWKRGHYCEGPDNDPALHPLFTRSSMIRRCSMSEARSSSASNRW